MMNKSAGEPKPASESASSAGATWPCGLTIGRFATAAYSRRAIVMRAGSGAKPRSGESVQGCVIGVPLPNLVTQLIHKCVKKGGAFGRRSATGCGGHAVAQLEQLGVEMIDRVGLLIERADGRKWLKRVVQPPAGCAAQHQATCQPDRAKRVE